MKTKHTEILWTPEEQALDKLRCAMLNAQDALDYSHGYSAEATEQMRQHWIKCSQAYEAALRNMIARNTCD